MDGLRRISEAAQNMKTAPAPNILRVAPLIGVDEARRLLDLAIQSQAPHAEDELSDNAIHDAMNKATALPILLPMTKP